MNTSGKCVDAIEMAINFRLEGRKTSRETTRHVGGIHRYKARLPKVASIFSAFFLTPSSLTMFYCYRK